VQKPFAIAASLALLCSGANLKADDGRRPLAEYVARPDATYAWTKRREGKLAGGNYVELTLTSQT